MEEQPPVWVNPGRVIGIETTPEGRPRVMINVQGPSFSARNLGLRGVIRDLIVYGMISDMDPSDVTYMVEPPSLPDRFRVGRPVMVEVDAEDEHVIHLHLDTLYMEPGLPAVLHLFCPEEQRGRWFRPADGPVYKCPCGRAIWDVLPE